MMSERVSVNQMDQIYIAINIYNLFIDLSNFVDIWTLPQSSHNGKLFPEKEQQTEVFYFDAAFSLLIFITGTLKIYDFSQRINSAPFANFYYLQNTLCASEEYTSIGSI